MKHRQLILHPNYTQQNCTLFTYLYCKYEENQSQTFRVIYDQKCIFFTPSIMHQGHTITLTYYYIDDSHRK